MIQTPHPAPDQQQKLITPRRSPFAQAYYVWWTSVTGELW